jgi:hypothetical protein
MYLSSLLGNKYRMGVSTNMPILIWGIQKETPNAIEYITGEIRNSVRASFFTSAGNSRCNKEGLLIPYSH